jgi:hypothetical protein
MIQGLIRICRTSNLRQQPRQNGGQNPACMGIPGHTLDIRIRLGRMGDPVGTQNLDYLPRLKTGRHQQGGWIGKGPGRNGIPALGRRVVLR